MGDVADEPPAADPTFEFVTVECIRPVHNELKIVKPCPLAARGLNCFVRKRLIQSCLNAFLFCTLKIQLPAFYRIRCFRLIFGKSFLPSTEGKCGEAYVYIAVSHRGYLLCVLFMDAGKILYSVR